MTTGIKAYTVRDRHLSAFHLNSGCSDPTNYCVIFEASIDVLHLKLGSVLILYTF